MTWWIEGPWITGDNGVSDEEEGQVQFSGVVSLNDSLEWWWWSSLDSEGTSSFSGSSSLREPLDGEHGSSSRLNRWLDAQTLGLLLFKLRREWLLWCDWSYTRHGFHQEKNDCWRLEKIDCIVPCLGQRGWSSKVDQRFTLHQCHQMMNSCWWNEEWHTKVNWMSSLHCFHLRIQVYFLISERRGYWI